MVGPVLLESASAPFRLELDAWELMWVWRAWVAHLCHLLLQQRGERDTQTQAILTKLKCAAGKEPGA